VLEGVVGLQNHCAELTGDEGDEDAFLVPGDVLHPYFLIGSSSGYDYRSTYSP
jgi:hypothetical protein